MWHDPMPNVPHAIASVSNAFTPGSNGGCARTDVVTSAMTSSA